MEQIQSQQQSAARIVKPGLVTALGIITLVNGIFNILAGLGLTFGVILSTLGLGVLCAPVTLLPAVLGVFEILYAVKIIADPPQPVQFSQTIAILEICCVVFGNGISLVVGILALVFYSDPSVKEYFAAVRQLASG